MILEGDFYTILQPVKGPGTIQAVLEFNASHAIFKGHFPGQPVVPGVCMLQILKELLEKAVGKSTRLSKGSELKFLSVIDPQRNSLVNVQVNYLEEANEVINVTASLFYNETVFFKFKGIFSPQ